MKKVLLAAICLGLVRPTPAAACGGFFCQQVPIDQSGEYILFSVDELGVRAYIQVQYQGAAEDFAWVVPVMTAPRKISVGVQQVFTTLMAATAPQFRVNWKFVGGSCGGRVSAEDLAGGSPTASPGGVEVIDKGEVGPYNYVVVSANESAKLKKWLDDNGFAQPPSAEAALGHYVKQGFVFVAIKLKRDAQVGDIQPLVLDMNHGETCVPLVLTRIAAIPDMPIYALVLGKHRAVPRNWFQVELNPARIDWFRNGSNYRALVTEAINDAAGRGFVTEFAGDTARFRQNLWSPGRYDLTRLQGITDPVRFVQAMLQLQLPRDPIIQSLLRKYIPMPASVRQAGVTEAQFYNRIANYQRELAGQLFDAAAFIKELGERVVTPLKDAQEMIDKQPYLTRLFTTVSPDEMTRDPLFDFNPDLKPVSNIHTAEGTGTCASDGRVSNVSLTFENGDRVSIPGTFQPFQGPPDMNYARGLPAARRVQLIGSTGEPITIARGRVKYFDQQLDGLDAVSVRAQARLEESGSTSSGCSIGRTATGAPLALAMALMALLRRRRRT